MMNEKTNITQQNTKQKGTKEMTYNLLTRTRITTRQPTC